MVVTIILLLVVVVVFLISMRIIEISKMAIFKKNVVKIAEENFEMWNKALQTKDPSIVKALYCSKSIFLPTLSGEIKLGQNGAEEYFLEFLRKDPFGIITKSEIEVVVCNRYVHVGKYHFEVGPCGQRQIVYARFTMIWQKTNNGDWIIKHHHSSLVPPDLI